MSPQFQHLEEQALRLPPEDREILADALLHSLEQAPLTEIDEAWISEAEKRFQDWHTSGKQGIPSEEFFRNIRRELGWS